MNILIVDLYGDGEILRLMDGTPTARACIEEFDAKYRAYSQDPDNRDYVGFTEFMEGKGIELHRSSRISLE